MTKALNLAHYDYRDKVINSDSESDDDLCDSSSEEDNPNNNNSRHKDGGYKENRNEEDHNLKSHLSSVESNNNTSGGSVLTGDHVTYNLQRATVIRKSSQQGAIIIHDDEDEEGILTRVGSRLERRVSCGSVETSQTYELAMVSMKELMDHEEGEEKEEEEEEEEKEEIEVDWKELTPQRRPKFVHPCGAEVDSVADTEKRSNRHDKDESTSSEEEQDDNEETNPLDNNNNNERRASRRQHGIHKIRDSLTSLGSDLVDKMSHALNTSTAPPEYNDDSYDLRATSIVERHKKVGRNRRRSDANDSMWTRRGSNDSHYSLLNRRASNGSMHSRLSSDDEMGSVHSHTSRKTFDSWIGLGSIVNGNGGGNHRRASNTPFIDDDLYSPHVYYRPGERTLKRCIVFLIVVAIVLLSGAMIGFNVPHKSVNLDESLSRFAPMSNFTEAEALKIAENIVKACHETSMATSSGRWMCQKLCQDHFCCFDKENDGYSCQGDESKMCSVYAGCEILVEEEKVMEAVESESELDSGSVVTTGGGAVNGYSPPSGGVVIIGGDGQVIGGSEAAAAQQIANDIDRTCAQFYTAGGRAECWAKCKDRMCCFEEPLCKNQPNKQCSLYSGCGVLAAKKIINSSEGNVVEHTSSKVDVDVTVSTWGEDGGTGAGDVGQNTAPTNTQTQQESSSEGSSSSTNANTQTQQQVSTNHENNASTSNTKPPPPPIRCIHDDGLDPEIYSDDWTDDRYDRCHRWEVKYGMTVADYWNAYGIGSDLDGSDLLLDDKFASIEKLEYPEYEVDDGFGTHDDDIWKIEVVEDDYSSKVFNVNGNRRLRG